MTLEQALTESYGWAEQHATLVFAVALAIPVLGTLLAWIGKGGRTDADGRFIASAVIGLATLAVVAEMVGVFIAGAALRVSLLDMNVLLLLAPVLCLVGSVLGIKLVFPLSELGSVRTLRDAGVFLLACAVGLWLLSTFRGWGVVFFGGLLQLLFIAALGWLLLRRLYRRAFRLDRAAPRRT
jgi:hypothetical protein